MCVFLNVHIFSSFNDNLNIFFCYAYLTGMYCLIENMPLYFTITSSIVWFLFGLYFKNLNMPFIDCATVSLLFIRRNCSNLENRFFLSWRFKCQHSKEMDPDSNITDNRQTASKPSKYWFQQKPRPHQQLSKKMHITCSCLTLSISKKSFTEIC